jgi:hypothetical protein
MGMKNLSSLLTVLLLPLASVPLLAQDSFPVSKAEKMESSSLKPIPSSGVVPLQVIAGDFAADQNAAVGKYSGRRITVVGRVSAVSNPSSENKVLTVTLQDASASLPAVKAEFLYGSIPVNSEIQVDDNGVVANIVRRDRSGSILSQEPYISVGQKVAIKGDFKEMKVGDIILTACKKVPKPRN